MFGIPEAHEFKMSVCEISFSAEANAFEVKFYLFQDDLKEALYDNPEAPELDKSDVDSYIIENVRLSFGDENQSLQFQSIQEKNDQVLVSYTLPCSKPPSFSKLLISNQLLIEKFKKQSNMVFLQMPDREKMTLILDAKKTEGEFELE